MDDDWGGESLDAKLAKLRADFGEDIEVYDFGDETFGNALDDGLNDFNDETFGGGSVGRDFDFSGSTAKFTGQPAPSQQQSAPRSQPAPAAWTTMPSLLSSSGVGKARSPWSGGINDDPLLGPMTASPAKPKPATPTVSAAKPPQPKMRTLDEIEAEMRAAKPATPLSAPTPPPAGPKARTLEEIEAEMLRKARTPPTAGPPQPTHAPQPTQSPHRGLPMDMAAKAQARQQAQFQQQRAAPALAGPLGSVGLPPISHPAHPAHPQNQEFLRLQQLQQQQMSLQAAAPQQQQQQMAIQQQQLALQQAIMARPLPGPAGSMTGPQALAALMGGQGGPPAPITGDLHRVAETMIQEHEASEAARRRKGAKIAEMSRFNGLMTQGDKDFITRIQVSQIVGPSAGAGSDPFADDFYFHVYSAIKMSRSAALQAQQAARAQPEEELAPGQKIVVAGGGADVGAGGGAAKSAKTTTERRMTRREHAMVRMAQNVQRIVDQAKDKPKMTQLSLEGALGKIALRSRSAPRQLLQVGSEAPAKPAADGENHPGVLSNSLPAPAKSHERRPAMTKRQLLMAIERLYASVLDIEQLRRSQPVLPTNREDPPEGAPTQADVQKWESLSDALKEKIWRQWRMMEPLDMSVPHPFVSLLSSGKGKRLLPRTMRLLTDDQSLQILTMLVATFATLDVVVDSDLVDRAADPRLAPSIEGRRSRAEAVRETDLFMNCVVGPIMGVINSTPLELVSGLLALLMERNNILRVARTKPGLAFITLFLSRAEMLRHLESQREGAPPAEAPSPEAIEGWSRTVALLHDKLSPDFMSLFPSVRAAFLLPPGTSDLLSDLVPRTDTDLRNRAQQFGCDFDVEDGPAWQMLTALAVASDASRQERLLAGIRNKVMDNVTAARKQTVPEPAAEAKLRNVNSLLRGLGLDASMITLQ